MANTIRPKIIILAVLLLFATNASAQQPARTAADYVAAGEAAQKEGKLEEALQQYAAAIKLDPKNVDAHFNSGACYLALRKPSIALGFFKAVVTLVPNDPIAHFSLSGAYAAIGQTVEAIESLKEVIRLAPKFVHAYVALADNYDRLGQYERALRELSVASQLVENDPVILYKLGRVSAHAGQLRNAIEYLNRSIAVRPMAPTYLELGFAYAKSNDYQAAILAYTESAKLDPTNELAHYNLGMALKQVGKNSEAVDAFKRAIELKPNFAVGFWYLGMTYQSLGQNEQFLAALQEANRLDPNNLSILETYAIALRANLKYAEAIEPLRRVSAAHPDDVTDLYVLGNTYLMAKRWGAPF